MEELIKNDFLTASDEDEETEAGEKNEDDDKEVDLNNE